MSQWAAVDYINARYLVLLPSRSGKGATLRDLLHFLQPSRLCRCGEELRPQVTRRLRSMAALPSLASRIAAALTFGPYTTFPAAPNGGATVGVSPNPLRPGYPTGLRSFDRSRDERSARHLALAAIESCDGEIAELVGSRPSRASSSAIRA